MSHQDIEEKQAAVIKELHTLHEWAQAIHTRLTELDIRTGAVGRARSLVQRLERTLALYEGQTMIVDAEERLAANAWRMHWFVTKGYMPALQEWPHLSEDTRAQWRAAARTFNGVEADDGE